MEPPAGLRERRRQRTRAAISGAAIALFLARGFDGVPVAEIAAAAGVSKPTLFKYFPTKEDLVLHRFADHQDEAGRTVRQRPPGASPLTALQRHFAAGLERRDPITGLSDDPEVVAFTRLVVATPALAVRLAGYIARSEAALGAALAEAARDGGRVRDVREAHGGPGREDGADIGGAAGAASGDLAAQAAAAAVIAVQRVLATDNWRRIAGGCSAADLYPEAAAAADQAFAMLRTGLGARFG